MADIEEKIVFEGDASSLVMTFDQLVNAITQTREELRQYRDDKEKTAELTKKLADQEQQLVQLMAKNNNVVDSSKVSYKQLNDILKDLNKTYKQTADASQRMNIAPASKAINQELKTMDANIGQYQRNVGNYAGAVDKAMASVRMNATQVLRELPSLKYGVEMFFIAISNNLPMLVESLERLKAARAAEKAASAEQVAMDMAEAKSKQGLAGSTAALGTAKATAANASVTEKNTEMALAKAEVEENQVTLQAVEADLEAIKIAKQKVNADIAQAKAQLSLLETEKARYRLAGEKGKAFKTAQVEQEVKDNLAASEARLNALEVKEVKTKEALTTATNNLTAAQERLNKAMAEGNMEKAGDAAGGAAKGMSKLSNVLVLIVTVLALFYRQIAEFVDNLVNLEKRSARTNEVLEEMRKTLDPNKMAEFNGEVQKTTRSLSQMQGVLVNSASGTRLFYKEQQELNKAMLEGAKGAAKEYVEIRLLDSIIQDAAKSEEDHNKAASKLVEILDDATITTKDVKEQTSAYKGAIDKLIESLYKQAQAQGAIQLLQARYSETVLKAQGELINAQLAQQQNKLQGFGQWLELYFQRWLRGFAFIPTVSKKDFLDSKVEKWQKQLANAKTEFEAFLAEITKKFNFDELFAGDDNGGGGNSGPDNWFSKWEMFIKKAETLQGTFVGEFQNINLAEAWKYSQAGLEAYMKKFDEYVAHYKGDVKQLKEIEIQRLQYIEERYQYQQKLIKQYASTDKTEKDRELAQLEEWYSQQKLIYETAGVDITDLVAEYNNRLEAIQRKYVDKYVNVGKEGLELELANLDEAFKKELDEYKRKGIETVNLVEHYAQESEKIHSKYAKEEVDAVIKELDRELEARKRLNDVSYSYKRMGGKHKGLADFYAVLGGTTQSGIGERRDEIAASEQELKIFQDVQNQKIAKMQEVLDSQILVGNEKLEMEEALAEAEMELTLGVYEYQADIANKRQAKLRDDTNEMLSYIQSGFQGLGSIFDDVYKAYERTTKAEVEQGKITQKEADKRLDEYRDVKAAAAAMDALGSAVGAYNSLASIPYVGPALGAAAAAAALAAGFANVKLIKATTKDNVGGGNDSYANVAPSLSEFTPQYTQNVTGQSDTDYLVNALTEKPIHCFVTESEVSAAQEIANKRERETTW